MRRQLNETNSQPPRSRVWSTGLVPVSRPGNLPDVDDTRHDVKAPLIFPRIHFAEPITVGNGKRTRADQTHLAP
jgi:hypothetical protein